MQCFCGHFAHFFGGKERKKWGRELRRWSEGSNETDQAQHGRQIEIEGGIMADWVLVDRRPLIKPARGMRGSIKKVGWIIFGTLGILGAYHYLCKCAH